jgi:protoheme IX farnesyltransferase
MTGRFYLVGAALLGVYFLYYGVRVARQKTLPTARGVLMASVVYLPVLYALMVVG